MADEKDFEVLEAEILSANPAAQVEIDSPAPARAPTNTNKKRATRKKKKAATDTQKSLKKRREKIAILTARGVTAKEIAKQVGVCERTVVYDKSRFSSVFKELENVKEYDKGKQELFGATEVMLLKRLFDEEKLEKASLNNVAYSLRNIFDMRRLEQGLSTSNQAVHHFTGKSPKLLELQDVD